MTLPDVVEAVHSIRVARRAFRGCESGAKPRNGLGERFAVITLLIMEPAPSSTAVTTKPYRHCERRPYGFTNDANSSALNQSGTGWSADAQAVR